MNVLSGVKEMISKTGRSGAMVGGLMVLLFSGSAAAQWHASAVGVAEVDTKHTLLLLGGLSASPGGKGVQPVIGVQAYHLEYDAVGRVNAFNIKPYVGLEDNYDGGQVGANIGYNWANQAGETPVAATATGAEQGKGTVVSGNWDYWGTGQPTGYQLLGSYNFHSKSVWTRGRVTERLGPNTAAQNRFGGEVAYLSGTGYSIWQPGLVWEHHDAKGNILGLGAGMKFFGFGGGNAVYVKVEGVAPLFR
jgi:hypothetical protein